MNHHDLAARTGTRGTPPLALLHAVDTAVAGDLGQDAALLADAAAVLTARQQLDELLTELAAQPFSASAYDGLRAYLDGPADQAVAAYERVCARMARRT